MQSVDSRSEIPQGMVWKEVPAIKAKFPMPQTWFFHQDIVSDTTGIAISRENMAATKMFVTGLSLNAVRHFDRKTIPGKPLNEKPSETGLRILKQQRDMEKIGRVVQTVEGPLISYKQLLQYQKATPAGSVIPMRFYSEFTGNDETGTFYIAYFETPVGLWHKYGEIGTTMIDRKILDPSV